jgi:hypothetical protein
MCRKIKYPIPSTFIELTKGDELLAKRLESLYLNVENVELYVGLMATFLQQQAM